MNLFSKTMVIKAQNAVLSLIVTPSLIKAPPKRKAKTDENEQNCPKILNNFPIFNLKPPLECSESQHTRHLIR